MAPQASVWQPLHALAPAACPQPRKSHQHPLVKPAYALVDAPLIWRLSWLHLFLIPDLHGVFDNIDENFVFPVVTWPSGPLHGYSH